MKGIEWAEGMVSAKGFVGCALARGSFESALGSALENSGCSRSAFVQVCAWVSSMYGFAQSSAWVSSESVCGQETPMA